MAAAMSRPQPMRKSKRKPAGGKPASKQRSGAAKGRGRGSGLEEYRAKREFGSTPEPPGGSSRPGSSRFVIQEHHARRLHWDLRIEHENVLASWALPKGIPLDPKQNRLAVRTEDHPLEYIDFEGEI